MDYDRLKATLKRHEGVRYEMYKCSEGFETIGAGHNLSTMPISGRAVDIILEDDIEIAVTDIKRNIMYFDDLPPGIQEALVNMCFNLGISRLMGFKKMWKAIEEQDYAEASNQALDSKWASQVHGRAVELAAVIRSHADV